MKIKAGWRSAALAMGLFVCSPEISQAAVDEDDATVSAGSESAGPPMALDRYTRHGSHRSRSHAHPKSSKVVPKSPPNKKADDVAGGDNSTRVLPAVIPAPAVSLAVANAYAQMPAIDTSAGNEKAVGTRANDLSPTAADNNAPRAAETQIVSADQLNDVDRTLQGGKPVAAKFAMASADTAVTTGGDENSAWARTSQIGKIFIGFGALLTMASAVRMFMA